MITITTYDGSKLEFKSFKELIRFDSYESIISLDCSNNYLSFLPRLPFNLKDLDCSNNKLTSLTSYRCTQSGIYFKFPPIYLHQNCPFIESINCTNNNLTDLPILPNKLQCLYASENKLISLPEIPKSLLILYCNENKLNSLPIIPEHIQYIYCSNNNISCLPNISENIQYMVYDKNPVHDFIYKQFSGNKSAYFEWKKKYQHLWTI